MQAERKRREKEEEEEEEETEHGEVVRERTKLVPKTKQKDNLSLSFLTFSPVATSSAISPNAYASLALDILPVRSTSGGW